MEPKRSSPQPQPQPQPSAATKKSPPRAAADAIAAGVDSPLSSLFHPASHGVNGKEQDLYAIIFKGQNGSAQASMTCSCTTPSSRLIFSFCHSGTTVEMEQNNGKSQWSPAKSRTAFTKDNKYDSVGTSSCFGSSVHYGGRDYYGSSAPKQAVEYSDYKVDKKDPVADSHGDWWQGSFYY